MLGYPVDVTPLTLGDDAAYELRQSAFTPSIDSRKLALQVTQFGVGPSNKGSKPSVEFEDITQFASFGEEFEDDLEVGDAFGHSLEVVEAANSRMRLLARNYVMRKSDKEMLTRIEILTQRLRKLSPRTTEAHIAAQEQMVKSIEEVDSHLDDIEKLLHSL